MRPRRTLETAQHEAAHIVVGAAVGVRLQRAVMGAEDIGRGWVRHGFAEFDWRGSAEALVLAFAAGPAWEKAIGHPEACRGDYVVLRSSFGYRRESPALNAIEIAAAAILATRGPAHARVTRALLERDLSASDIEAIARGERLPAED